MDINRNAFWQNIAEQDHEPDPNEAPSFFVHKLHQESCKNVGVLSAFELTVRDPPASPRQHPCTGNYRVSFFHGDIALRLVPKKITIRIQVATIPVQNDVNTSLMQTNLRITNGKVLHLNPVASWDGFARPGADLPVHCKMRQIDRDLFLFLISSEVECFFDVALSTKNN